MASPEVAPLLAKEFVTLKLDYDRAKGAKEIERRYVEKDQGLPWIAFIDGNGAALVTSTMPDGNNTGFPAKADEIAHFKAMLEKAKRHLTDAEIGALVKSLEEASKKAT